MSVCTAGMGGGFGGMDGVGMGGGFGGRDMTPMGRMGGKSTTSPSTQLSLTCAASVDSRMCLYVCVRYVQVWHGDDGS